MSYRASCGTGRWLFSFACGLRMVGLGRESCRSVRLVELQQLLHLLFCSWGEVAFDSINFFFSGEFSMSISLFQWI